MRARPTGSTAAPTPGGLGGLDTDTTLLVLAKAASALADPVRLRILRALRAQGELTVGELTRQLPVSQPRVSIHLGCLTECGYTRVRRSGRRSYHRLAGPSVEDLLDRLDAHAERALPGLLACLSCGPARTAGATAPAAEVELG